MQEQTGPDSTPDTAPQGATRQPLSAFVTTFNNARTLEACLRSVAWADEILVLDSFSTDRTLEIASAYGCRILQHRFMGYGKQKQMALEKTTHDWVLLLDADEAVTPELAAEIRDLLAQGPAADGYTMRRNEQMFWRMMHPGTRMNHFLRLFNRHKGHITDMPVHAAPAVQGRIERLKGTFYHYGETDIHTKVDKVNAYSTGLVPDKLAKGARGGPWIAVLYPPVYFLRIYIYKRLFLNGWAGLYASAVSAFYVFLKYAKIYEHRRFEALGQSRMPEGAPEPPERGQTPS
jgi:glycosyltransferase involved in cell wall biosynthesis